MFKPEDNMTRAEVVSVINRMLKRMIELKDIPDWAPVYIDLTDEHWSYAAIMEASVGHEYERKRNRFEIWLGIIN
jgi:hypothetical protein